MTTGMEEIDTADPQESPAESQTPRLTALPVTAEQLEKSSPRRASLLAAVFYALSALSLGYPAISGKFLAGQYSDQFIAGYAFREFGASVLAATGGFAQWNPYLFGGMPFVAAMHGDIFYPTFLMRMVMPTDVAMTWSFILHLFLAGFFTFRFLRASGFSFFPSLAGGAAYMMSGQLASLVSPGHDGKLTVSALFPLALWMVTLGVRSGKRWSWGVLALAVGLAVLSPHPQLLQYMLLATAAFTIHLAVSSFRRGTAVIDLAKRLGLALFSVAVGLAIGAIQYLPVREYVAWSPRAGGLPDYETATSFAWPVRELFDAYLPQFTGMIEAYWGVNSIHLHSDYLGAIVLLLAGAAFGGLRSDPRKGFVLFWAVTLVIAYLWAVGGDTPFYRIPYAIVPGTKYFRAPATVFFVGTLALAVLAATGTERALMRKVSARYAVGWIAFASFIVALAVTGVLNDFAQALAPADMVDSVIANAGQVTMGAWRSFAFVLVAAVLIIVYTRTRTLPHAAVGMAIAALVAIDAWTIMRKYWVFSEPAAFTYRSDAAIEKVKADPQPSRVLALEMEPNPLRDTNLQGDGLMIHRVRGVLGYHGNQLARYNNLLQKDQGFQQVFNPRVWQLLNVRYLLTNSADVGTWFPGAQWVIGPVTDAAGTKVYLYRLPGENPYAWVTSSLVKADDDAVVATIFNEGFDLRSAALFAPESGVAGPENLAMLPIPARVEARVTRYEPGAVSVELSEPAPAGTALVLSENFYPGWRATVDGKEASIGRVNYTLTGVPLPEGGRKVEVTFHSTTYDRGKMITLFALVLTVSLISAGIIMERKAVA